MLPSRSCCSLPSAPDTTKPGVRTIITTRISVRCRYRAAVLRIAALVGLVVIGAQGFALVLQFSVARHRRFSPAFGAGCSCSGIKHSSLHGPVLTLWVLCPHQ